jgi:hypothetical protein
MMMIFAKVVQMFLSVQIFRLKFCTRRVGHIARMGEMRHEYKLLVGEQEWKIQFGLCIKLDHNETGCADVKWIHLA